MENADSYGGRVRKDRVEYREFQIYCPKRYKGEIFSVNPVVTSQRKTEQEEKAMVSRC